MYIFYFAIKTKCILKLSTFYYPEHATPQFTLKSHGSVSEMSPFGCHNLAPSCSLFRHINHRYILLTTVHPLFVLTDTYCVRSITPGGEKWVGKSASFRI